MAGLKKLHRDRAAIPDRKSRQQLRMVLLEGLPVSLEGGAAGTQTPSQAHPLPDRRALGMPVCSGRMSTERCDTLPQFIPVIGWGFVPGELPCFSDPLPLPKQGVRQNSYNGARYGAGFCIIVGGGKEGEWIEGRHLPHIIRNQLSVKSGQRACCAGGRLDPVREILKGLR